jgi:putative ABC transport system permease protein
VGRILLVFRLVLGDVRRHPAQAAMLLVSITAATALLSLGGSLHGATDALYRHTRATTAGPDLVASSPGINRTATSALEPLQGAPGVVAHSGLYHRFFTELTAHGATVRTVAQSTNATPGPIDRPLVTAGRWVRPGGVVVERGFAAALGIDVGDHITIADRSLPVVGIAVTAANTVYPWAQMGGPGGGPSDNSGLIWLSEPDTRPLVSAHVPVVSALQLKLRDADATQAFVDSYRKSTGDTHRGATTPVDFFTWQFIATQDSFMLRGLQPILVIGSWLLGFVAITGVATLAAGRAARQTRRVGLLKAVGATPGLIATVLLAEYLTLALLADALGLTVARLTERTIINPSGSLLTTATGPSSTIIVITTVLALGVAALTTLGPTLRALRTETITALADPAHRPQHRARLTKLSALLPTPLLLGVRLIARRPGRAVLHACSTAATQAGLTFLLMVYAEPVDGYDLGSTTMTDLRMEQGRHVLLAVTAALLTLALVNTMTITWTTALEARPTMAIARTLGSTPGQITAGLSIAQLLPTLPGVIAGMSLLLYLPFGADQPSVPPTWWLLTAALGPLLATAALTAIPARLAAHRSVAQTLSAEAA